MARRYGIDTSILVRLVTRDPQSDYERCVRKLADLVERQECEILASNQAIGEAYAALMHHYGITSADARSALFDILTSGLVAPMNGPDVLEALTASAQPGLFDRLIVDGYSRAGLETLTLDRRMGTLPNASRI